MEKRLNMKVAQLKANNAMLKLEASIQASDLSKTHINLIKMHASQINGCAYCLDMHSKESMNSGETLQRLSVLSTWKETGNYLLKKKK